MPIKRALISVSDKSGIAEFAKSLSLLDIEIISTGGTAKLLQEMNIPVTCLLYTSPSPRDRQKSRMPSSA